MSSCRRGGHRIGEQLPAESPAPRAGRDLYVKGSAGFLAAFPDWRAEVHDVVASGDLVTDRVHITATHTASINNVPPTGEKIDDDCAHIWRIENGVLVEGWLFCTANMLRVMALASRPSPTLTAGD